MGGESGLELVEAPEVFLQTKLQLHPRQGLVLQPVQGQRRQLIEPHQLLAQHGQQDQQHQQHQQTEQSKYGNHPPGPGEPPALQTIDQRVAQIGEQNADQKRCKDWRKQVDQPGA